MSCTYTWLALWLLYTFKLLVEGGKIFYSNHIVDAYLLNSKNAASNSQLTEL